MKFSIGHLVYTHILAKKIGRTMCKFAFSSKCKLEHLLYKAWPNMKTNVFFCFEKRVQVCIFVKYAKWNTWYTNPGPLPWWPLSTDSFSNRTQTANITFGNRSGYLNFATDFWKRNIWILQRKTTFRQKLKCWNGDVVSFYLKVIFSLESLALDRSRASVGFRLLAF